MGGLVVGAVTTNDNKAGEHDCDIVFRPGAQRVAQAYSGTSRSFSNGKPYPANRDDLLNEISLLPAGLDMFAYFGHGYNDQLGNHITSAGDIQKLGDALKPKMKPGGSIVFYSCLAGSAGGLTSQLLKHVGNGVWIYGHTTTAHSFKNPAVSEAHEGSGLKFRLLQDIFGPSLRAAWEESLARTDLWLRFPLMHHVDIMKELNAIRLVGTWTVPPSGKYVFDWKVENKKYSTEESLCVNPSGSVKDAATARTGTWELDDALVISWKGGGEEVWSLPLNPDGQTIKGLTGRAKRIKRGDYGIVQG